MGCVMGQDPSHPVRHLNSAEYDTPRTISASERASNAKHCSAGGRLAAKNWPNCSSLGLMR
jgi:hypothetical protein